MDERWRGTYDAWKLETPEEEDERLGTLLIRRKWNRLYRDPDDARDAQQDREMRGDDRDMGDD
mgnify:CR=1 FL=1